MELDKKIVMNNIPLITKIAMFISLGILDLYLATKFQKRYKKLSITKLGLFPLKKSEKVIKLLT